jgi:hypothetical protein
MVIVEKAVDRRITSNNTLYSFTRILDSVKKLKTKASIFDDLGLYNMEEILSSKSKIDLGIELYDIESSWK